jgi:rhodanese-related sulfurtransferase
VAEGHLVELQRALQQLMDNSDHLAQVDREELLAQAKRGEVIVLDVRPPEEFDTAHLPYARSVPLAELTQQLAELPLNLEIVAYCLGPFCLMADEAVKLLRERGYRARKTFDGVSEWQAAGLPVRGTVHASAQA